MGQSWCRSSSTIAASPSQRLRRSARWARSGTGLKSLSTTTACGADPAPSAPATRSGPSAASAGARSKTPSELRATAASATVLGSGSGRDVDFREVYNSCIAQGCPIIALEALVTDPTPPVEDWCQLYPKQFRNATSIWESTGTQARRSCSLRRFSAGARSPM